MTAPFIQKMMQGFSHAVEADTEIVCPPSERMKHLEASRWSIPNYPATFQPSTAEINSESEVLAFLYGLVLLLKPKVIVETGSYAGFAARAMAAAVSANGIGMVHTFDTDPAAFSATQTLLQQTALRLGSWEAYQLPALSRMDLLTTCDFLFSDSSYESRMQEIRLIKPGAVGVLHDTGMEEHLDTAIRSLYPGSVFIPTPRGLTIFQKQ